jgi:small multidrug resistance pump
MSPFGLATLAIAIVAEVVATSLLKASDGFTRPLPTAFSLLGYAIAFYCLSLALRTVPVGVAYAIWAGIGLALISTAGWLLFGEKLDWAAILGIGLILAGVLVINLLSGSVRH